MKRKAGWTARNAIALAALTSLIVLSFAGAAAAVPNAGAAAAYQRERDRAAAAAAVPGGTLDPLSITKYVTPLVIPPAMPETSPNYYEIAVKQFQQQILPTGMPMTTVWSYGLVGDLAGTLNYPAFTIEAVANQRLNVKWVNGLVDATGAFLPPIVPVDQTLHWANPNKSGAMGTTDSVGNIPTPYTGPVPIITHVHGAHVGPESDGYPEAWYLPAANNIPAGYATRGSHWGQIAGAPDVAGAALFSYPNDQAAATLWYHDHTLGMTRTNVISGPAGFFLLRGGPNDLAPGTLPGPAPARGDVAGTKYYEIPIAIQDRSFNVDGSLFFPDNRAFFEGLNVFAGAGTTPPYLNIPFIPALANGGLPSDVSPIWNPEFFGNTMVVNGKTWPTLAVEARRYRFRLLNGSNARTLILKTDVPVPIWQIGGDQGFLPAPLAMTQLLMMPAERNDVIVDFTGIAPGTTITLQNIGPDIPFNGANLPAELADPGTTGQVMQFQVVAPISADTSTDPATIAVLPSETPLAAATVTRYLSLNEEMSATVTVTTDVSGNVVYDPASVMPFGPTAAKLGTFDPISGLPTVLKWMDPITELPIAGTTEVWEIKNFTVDAHPIHPHQVAFEVVNRQVVDATSPHWTGTPGVIVPPEAWETGRKDTVIAYPGEITRVKAIFDLAGLYVWHCHIIDHEDNEMMRPYSVAPAALDHFTFATISSPQTAGAAFVATITAQDAFGNTETAYNGTATLTASIGTIVPAAATFVNGVATPSVTIPTAQAAVAITATSGAATGTSNSFTVAATTTATAGQPTVTNPNTGGSFARLSVVPVRWTIPAAVGTGSFQVYVRTATGTLYYLTTQAAVAGQVAYTFNWTVTQPAGTGYQIMVWYRNAAGSWLFSDLSDVAFAITSVPQPTVTNPNTGGSFTQGSVVPVSWVIPAAVATGNFSVYARTSTGTLYNLAYRAAVAGQTAYSFNWTVTQPAGTGYQILVWYRDAAGNWLYSDLSNVAFAITAAVPGQPTVTNPNAGGSFARLSVVPVSWTIPAAVSTGIFQVYARTSTGTLYFLASRAAVAAQTAYSFNWTVTQPVGAGYQILVWYRDAAGNWLYSDVSNVAFTIL